MSQTDNRKEIDNIRRQIQQLKRQNEAVQQNLKKLQKEEEPYLIDLLRVKREMDQMAERNKGDKKLIRMLEEQSERVRRATLVGEENMHRFSQERKRISNHVENQITEWNKKIRRLEESK